MHSLEIQSYAPFNLQKHFKNDLMFKAFFMHQGEGQLHGLVSFYQFINVSTWFIDRSEFL